MIFFFCLVTTVSVVTLSGCGYPFKYCEPIVMRVDNVYADLVRVTGIGEDLNGYVHYNVENLPYGSSVGTYDSIAFKISYDLIRDVPSMMGCTPTTLGYDDISSINVKSNADYDNSHQSGTSLNDIFVFSSGPGIIISVDEYIEYSHYRNTLMMMSIAPEFERTHTFTIEITFEDGKVFSQQLDPVTIKI